MRNSSDRDDLLNDVLEEVAPPAFRAQVFQEALEEVRFRKRLVQFRRGALVLACVAIMVVLGAKFVPFEGSRSLGKINPLIIHSRLLTAQMLISSRPDTVDVVTTANASVTLVQSSAGTYSILGDDQLLALLAGRPAVLVRRGVFDAELVFVNPADRDGFPVQ